MGISEFAADLLYLDVTDFESLFLYNLQIAGNGINNYFYYRPLWTYGSKKHCVDLYPQRSEIVRCAMQSLPIYNVHAFGITTGSIKDIIYGSIFIRVSNPEDS
jgi:hypothetical protein